MNVHHARTVVKKKIGKQAPQGKPVVEQRGPVESGPPNSEQVTASARSHGERIREALRCGEPSLLDQVSNAGVGVPVVGAGLLWKDVGGKRPDEAERGRERQRQAKRKTDVQQGLVALAAGSKGIARMNFVQQISSEEDEAAKPNASSRDRKRKKCKRDGRRRRSSSSRPSSRSSSSSVVATRDGGVESLAVASRKKPGKLLRSGLMEMRQYLLDHGGAAASQDSVGEDWRSTKVGAYISQVLFVNHSPDTVGIRNAREIVTLATCLDHLLSGQLARAGDVLMQRLKAVESSLTDGWSVARHNELIPPARPAIANDRERDFAAKAALRAARLQESLQKARVQKVGLGVRRPTGSSLQEPGKGSAPPSGGKGADRRRK